MIRYTLVCEAGHRFDAWFRDSAAYDDQRARGLVACADCGDVAVEKTLMAPAVAAGRRAPAAPQAPAPAAKPPADAAKAAEALRRLRAHVEKTADYVGPRFAQEARRRHLEAPDARPVWGEASAEQARDLLEDGVPIAPLPPLPRRDD